MDRLHTIITGIGAVCFLWFVIPFFAGVINIGNLTGTAVSVLLFGYGIFYRSVHAFLSGAWQRKGGKAALVMVAFIAAGVVIVAFAETVGMVHAATNRPPENTTAIVLGCKVNGTKPSTVLKERLEAAYKYLTKNPDAICVLSGGQGAGEDISEAECMYRYLTEKGIEGERLLREDVSTTTEENLLFSMELLKEQGVTGEAITIVTSEFHEYRANKTAKRMGITSYSTPSGTFFLYLPTYYVRELYGILYYMIK